MNPLEILNLSEPLLHMIASIEDRLMRNIVNRLIKYMYISSSTEWELKMLAEVGGLHKENLTFMKTQMKNAPKLLHEILESAAYKTAVQYETGFAKLIKKGIINNTRIPIHQTIVRVLKVYEKQAQSRLNMVNTVMQYKAKKVYRALVKSTLEIANKQEFLTILQNNTGGVVTGAYSRQKALMKTLQEFNERGIPAFVDKRGREWSPEAYVNMDIRTTVNNVAHQTQFERMQDYGISLLEVTSHSGARPKCAKDQGKIFDIENKSRKYPHWTSSSYGEPDGILGINCGHDVYPHIEGIHIRRYFPTENIIENDLRYQEKQGQRELERKVKAQKRLAEMYKQLGDHDAYIKAKQKAQNRNIELKDYCESKGLTYRADRVRIARFDIA